MTEQERPQKRGSGFFRLFERGVDTATRNNVTAYGYSVSITAAFAILQTSRTDTGVFEIFLFAAGAVGLRHHRSRSLWLLSGRARRSAQQREVACGRTIVLFGRLGAGGRVPRWDPDRRQGGLGSECPFDDGRLYIRGRGRVSRGAPDVAERRVGTCTKVGVSIHELPGSCLLGNRASGVRVRGNST